MLARARADDCRPLALLRRREAGVGGCGPADARGTACHPAFARAAVGRVESGGVAVSVTPARLVVYFALVPAVFSRARVRT